MSKKSIDFNKLLQIAPNIINLFHFFMDDFYPGWRTQKSNEDIEVGFFLFVSGMSGYQTLIKIWEENDYDKSELLRQMDETITVVDNWIESPYESKNTSQSDTDAAIDMANRIIQKKDNLPKDLEFVIASDDNIDPYKHKNGLTPEVCQEELNKAIGRAKAAGKTEQQINDALRGFNQFRILPNYTIEDISALFDNFFNI